MNKISNRLVVIIGLALLYISFSACEKDGGNPSISLSQGGDFVGQDTMLMVGDSINVGIEVAWNGVNSLDKLEIFLNGDLVSMTDMSLDQAQFQIVIVKGISDAETWSFTVSDTKKNSATVDLVLTKDPNSIYGPIRFYDNTALGAQQNLVQPGFISISSGELFTLDGAYMNQAKIDLLFYYDGDEGAVLASPGANVPAGIFEGDHSLGNWTTVNTTYFQKVEMTADDFDRIFHDGSILTNFDQDIAKRKAKALAVNDVYVFKTESGIHGILMVLEVEPIADGLLRFAMKVQDN